jgi:putative transposase
MARRWHLGACRDRIAATATRRGGTKRLAQRGDCGRPDRENGPKRGQRGYDAGKRTKGRKRHIAVDTDGNLLACVVHSAGIQDRVGARAVLMRLFCRVDTIETVYADGGYTGKLVGWAKEMFGFLLQIVKRSDQKGFVVLPKRWVVERSFAWMNWPRRLSKDFEINPKSSETMIHIANVHRLLRRTN